MSGKVNFSTFFCHLLINNTYLCKHITSYMGNCPLSEQIVKFFVRLIASG